VPAQVLEDERESEQEQEGLLDVTLHHVSEEDAFDEQADDEQEGDGHEHPHEGGQTEYREQQHCDVPAEHEEVAVGDVHDVHDTEDEREPDGGNGVDATEQDAVDYRLPEERQRRHIAVVEATRVIRTGFF